MLQAQNAPAMLVTGVDRKVTPDEFAAEFDVPMRWMDCCITLGYSALDTRGNARKPHDGSTERGVRYVAAGDDGLAYAARPRANCAACCRTISIIVEDAVAVSAVTFAPCSWNITS